MLHRDARPQRIDTAAAMMDCCQPDCLRPAQDRVASQVPLCEVHIMDVYKATSRLLTYENSRNEEYSLLPSEQRSMPGPCPCCGLCGYLSVTLTDKVSCLNASCLYEAWVDEFESLRRRLLFQVAGSSSVVYYIKFRDRVKIGTTSNLKQRAQTLQTVEILYGFEPGDRVLELQRHKQFAVYRTVGEWFDDNERIRAHVNNVCSIAA